MWVSGCRSGRGSSRERVMRVGVGIGVGVHVIMPPFISSPYP